MKRSAAPEDPWFAQLPSVQGSKAVPAPGAGHSEKGTKPAAARAQMASQQQVKATRSAPTRIAERLRQPRTSLDRHRVKCAAMVREGSLEPEEILGEASPEMLGFMPFAKP